MEEVEKIIKSRVEDLEKKITKTKKLIEIARESGIDTTRHEIEIGEIEDKVKKIKKLLG